MQVKRLTEQQCIRIIANSYLGEPCKRTGKQKDYHDYKADIDRRLWEIQEKKHSKIFKSQDKALKEFLDIPARDIPTTSFNQVSKTPIASNNVFQRPFKLGIRWDLISRSLCEQL